MFLDPMAVLMLQLGVAAIFAGALWHKLYDIQGFQEAVAAYVKVMPLAGRGVVVTLSWALILMEICAVIAILMPSPFAAVPAVALLALYGLAMAFNIARGNRLLDCGCSWGASRQPVGYHLVVRNAILAGLASLLLLPSNARTLASVDLIGGAMAAVLLLLVYAAANQLIANAHKLGGEPA